MVGKADEEGEGGTSGKKICGCRPKMSNLQTEEKTLPCTGESFSSVWESTIWQHPRRNIVEPLRQVRKHAHTTASFVAKRGARWGH